MQFRITTAARKTGAILEKLVREEMASKHITDRDCVICYGLGYNGPLPALNAHCSAADKMEQGIRLARVLGPQALRVIPVGNLTLAGRDILPAVARRRHHTKGKDIRVCRTLAGIRAMLANGRHDFVTPLVESDTEYRVFVYRKRVLCAYEKQLTEPEKNVKFGRNRANGWTFHRREVESLPAAARQAAVAAVRALDLDFGAVDMLATGPNVAVLEVNSAPGVSDEHRSGIVSLARRVTRWVANGCPTREN